MMSSSTFQIDKLDNSNYDTWCVQMKCILVQSDLWSIANGTVVKPADKVQSELWQQKNEKALATIILSVKTNQLNYIKNCKSALEAWKKLGDVYRPSGPIRKVTLYKKLLNLRMSETTSMSEYLNSFTEISERLAEVGIEIAEELLVIILLSSLPKDFENFIIAIETRDSLPSLDLLKIKLIEEGDRRIQHGDGDEAVVVSQQAFVARSKQHMKNKNNNNSNNNSNGRKVKCYNCGKRGHLAKNCRGTKQNGDDTREQHRSFAMLAAGNSNTFDKSSWCVDSGATSHMCCQRNLFVNYVETNEKIALACDSYIEAEGKGDVKIKTQDGDITLREVLYVPGMVGNFISVGKAVENGCTVRFDDNSAKIVNKMGEIILEAVNKTNLFMFTEYHQSFYFVKNFLLSNDDAIRWHNRYGHLNFKSMCDLINKNAVSGLNIKDVPRNLNCTTCMKSKICSQPFPSDQNRAENLLDLIHTDVCGPMNKPSLSGSRYFVLFIDDHSRYVFVYFMKNKNEVLDKFKMFKLFVEKQLNRSIKCVRSDNGREYVNSQFDKFLEENGIQRQLTVPYTPQQNGISERANRTIVEMARSMILYSAVDEILWAEAVNTAVYIRNRSITKILTDKTPFEIWHGKKPNVAHFRIFGSPVVALDKTHTKKFSAKGKDYIFVGYSTTAKAYRLFDVKERKIVDKRDVIFCENVFVPKTTNDIMEFTVPHNNTPAEDEQIIEKTSAGTDEEYESSSEIGFMGFESDSDDEDKQPSTSGARSRGRPKIIRSGNVGRPRKVHNMINLAEEITIPINFQDAISCNYSEKWRDAMNCEYTALQENDTWHLVELPPGKKAIGCKWVYNVKKNEEGSVTRFKARLVAKGCSQEYGINFKETFSPVLRYSSIRLIFAIAAEKGLYLHHVDISTAYLNSTLDEEVYMKQPDGFQDERYPGQVLRLKKAIYGLKQSGRSWNTTLDAAIRSMNFKACDSEPCIYTRHENGKYNFIAVYVDDILIACSADADLHSIKDGIANKFKLVDNGNVKQFLGMEIKREGDTGKISVGHTQYIEKVLMDYGMENSRPASTPLDPGFQISCNDENCEQIDVKGYQSLIGTLMYLAISTRPDILHSICKLAQRNQNPHVEHEKAAKHVLRYLRTTKHLGLQYSKKINPQLVLWMQIGLAARKIENLTPDLHFLSRVVSVGV
ncbi:Retrovirus-related Pol polyprotein from transposon TNT 1-94 [Lucilia cuprina]|nr:Retrovirus-related Pol polyprotein from transposon TNT 1-94 [Lucilia cuprina]